MVDTVLSEYFKIQVQIHPCISQAITATSIPIQLLAKYQRLFQLDGTYQDVPPSGVLPVTYDLHALGAFNNPTFCPLTSYSLISAGTFMNPLPLTIFSMDSSGKLTIFNYGGVNLTLWTNVGITVSA